MDYEIDELGFNWLDEKAADNVENHGVSFQEAAEVFLDRRALHFQDVRHSTPLEKRWTAIGASFGGDILRVTYKRLSSGIIHIISARFASGFEEEWYDEGS
jgi:uncharacterized protein